MLLQPAAPVSIFSLSLDSYAETSVGDVAIAAAVADADAVAVVVRFCCDECFCCWKEQLFC